MKATKFYTSEIVLALEHLHGLNVVHRYVCTTVLSNFLTILTALIHLQLSYSSCAFIAIAH